ncbi:MAG: O-antigen translocase [Sphingobacteriales bacterium]|nr:MAG: O-antigen translocase [Sphingobacteriales bacterium]
MSPPEFRLKWFATLSKSDNSYGQILRSSSIVGGAQGLNYVIGMLRIKAVALLLGPAGVGLIGLYQATISLIGTIAGLGIGTSGVREIAAADRTHDAQSIGRTVAVLKLACWVTGFLGWGVTIVFAWPLSVWTFGTGEHWWALALLGGTLLLNAVSGGQSAILQGVRRIGDLARFSILSVIVGTSLSIALYSWLGKNGIVPVLVMSALTNVGLSWWFARKIPVVHVTIPWRHVWPEARRLVTLGVAFMWGGLLTGAVDLATSAMIVRQLGVEANGAYQAAWALSGMFAGFILGAMGADFYPRLTAVANDHPAMNRLVNEQTEVGALLSLPGLMATLAVAPWLMQIFYSVQFLPGAALLPWFVVGVFGRVISWPMGYIFIAKGASRLFTVTETLFAVFRLSLVIYLLDAQGLVGPSIAIAIVYGLYAVGVAIMTNRITGFYPSLAAMRVIGTSLCLVCVGFLAQHSLEATPGLIVGCVLTIVSAIYCLRGIAQRLTSEHRVVRLILQLPGMKACCS